VAFIAILISLHHKRSRSYSAYLGKKMKRYTRDNSSQIRRITLFCTQDGGCNQTEILRVGPRQIMMRHFITDMWSRRQIITPTFLLSDILSRRHLITPTLY